MATGVFHTARTGQNLRSRKRRGAVEPLDRFADYLADHDAQAGNPGGSVVMASSRLGVSTSTGYHMFRRICDALGDQAR